MQRSLWLAPNGLTVDLPNFDTVEVDPATNRVTAGGNRTQLYRPTHLTLCLSASYMHSACHALNSEHWNYTKCLNRLVLVTQA